jgi:hypothetical protein
VCLILYSLNTVFHWTDIFNFNVQLTISFKKCAFGTRSKKISPNLKSSRFSLMLSFGFYFQR